MAAGILFAYANDKGQSLNFLEREINVIYEHINRMDKAVANPIRLKDVSVNQLFNEFINRKKELKVFHFSGHAGQLDLLFADGTAVNGEGIAGLIKALGGLQLELVFLNGCATRALIPALHASGVRTVIASSRKVFDSVAAEFSIHFYTSLSQFETIEASFEYARNYFISLKKPDIASDAAERHIETGNPGEGSGEEFPFGIYHNPRFAGASGSTEEQEGWSLGNPDAENPDPSYNPGVQLLKAIGSKGDQLAVQLSARPDRPAALDAEIAEFGQLANAYQAFLAGTQDLNNAKGLYDKVESLLPQPLGEVIRQVMANAKGIGGKNGRPDQLLKYLLRFYEILIKLACFTMLSDLYEVLQKKSLKKEQVKFDPEVRDRIMALLSMDRKNAIEFNYRDLIADMRRMILLNDGKPFVDEFNTTPPGQRAVNADVAHGYIKWQKTMARESNVRGGYLQKCRKVEDELCHIFDEVYFILRYNLLVIRNVEVVRFRFNPVLTYDHWVMLLRGGQSSFQSYEQPEYTENYSVILVRGMSRIVDYLSLSPFIIDKEVLTVGENSDLYYYSHIDGDALVYEAVQDENRAMKIEKAEKEMLVWKGAIRITETIPYVPFMDSLDKAKMDVRKVTTRLLNILEQFNSFKKEMARLTAPEQPASVLTEIIPPNNVHGNS